MLCASLFRRILQFLAGARYGVLGARDIDMLLTAACSSAQSERHNLQSKGIGRRKPSLAGFWLNHTHDSLCILTEGRDR
jgi:hypothetical protein